jgi:prepilin peptidase CpaA
MMAQYLPVASIVLAGAAAAWSDLRWRKIPNLLCLALTLAGLAFWLVTGGAAPAGSALAHSVCALAVGFALFSCGAIGAGDAKYYAAAAAWFPLGSGLRLLLHVSVAGAVLLVVWFIWRRVAGKKVKVGAANEMDKFPYGIAIAAGSITMALLAW